MTDWIEDLPYDPEPRSKQPTQPSPVIPLSVIARWLARPGVLDYVRKQTWARDFYDEITTAVERCADVIKPPHERESRVMLGPHGCGGRVIATIPPEGGKPTATCTDCGAAWAGVLLQEVARNVQPDDTLPVWVSVETAAEEIGCTTRWVRYLVAEGKIREERFSARRRLLHKGDVLAEAHRRMTAL